MELIFSIIIGCFSIGVILSAPMGPIGILCVQRTLNNGRNCGLYTGVGAAISDLLYCLLTGLGMSIVTDWIEANQNILQVIGSVLLLVYAVYMIMHTPVPHNIEDDGDKRNNPTQEMLTGFLFTLSNPMIIFLIIPLFARFTFPMPDYRWYMVLLGYLMIVVGALSWWAVITYAVDKVRSQFNFKSMRKINVVMGSIILLLSLYGFASGLWEYLKEINVI